MNTDVIDNPTTLDDLNNRALALSQARLQLGSLVQALNAALEAMKANELPTIRLAIEEATTAWAQLEAGIQANPGLFVKPRTVAAHGITFGIQKGKGAIVIPDPERTVALIRKHLPEQAQVLIAQQEQPVKKAVEKLSAVDLKKIGVHLADAGDQVVIRPAPSDVDKLVKALVKATLEEAEASPQ